MEQQLSEMATVAYFFIFRRKRNKNAGQNRPEQQTIYQSVSRQHLDRMRSLHLVELDGMGTGG